MEPALRAVPDFSPAERDAVYRAIECRRDVRTHFVAEPVPDDVLRRVLDAAHHAPSVGLSQPWRFIIVRSDATKAAVHDAFLAANAVAASRYDAERAAAYRALRLEGIRSASLNICVVCREDPERGHGLGRQTIPETVRYSAVCAVQNLWLAARVEGLGVGWVSIVDPDALRRILAVPAGTAIIAYLCVGYVSRFESEPDLMRARWESRIPLDGVIDFERYGAGATPS